MASIRVDSTIPAPHVVPTEVYSASFPITSPVLLRIATGGAGQSGLVRALADAFIEHEVQARGCKPFAVAWLASDTSASFNHLASRAADLSITYHVVAEEVAIRQGIADRSVYAWRDHWLLVGPKSNPANLRTDNNVSVHDHFCQLFQAAVETSSLPMPVRFLSRYDKSAANIKESNIWSAIGQTPWSEPYSHWYHRYVEFPFAALQAAAQLGEYTLTDRGSWFAVEPWIRDRMAVFKAGGDDEDDPMINPAHALIGTAGANRNVAHRFADWLAQPDGGQQVVAEFAVGGVRLYSRAPAVKMNV